MTNPKPNMESKKVTKPSKERVIKEDYKRELRLFVQRLIKMAKEQIVIGRNYGWTQDSMIEELNAFINIQIDKRKDL